MLPDKLPKWAQDRIETFFGFQGLSYTEGLYSVLNLWCVDVAYRQYGDIINIPTVFAIVRPTRGDIYCFRITEDSFEVSNIICAEG